MNPVIQSRNLSQMILAKAKDIKALLLSVQSVHTSEDEITRAVEVLTSITEIEYMLQDKIVNKTVSFFPLNLPLYSLILFGCIPSMQSQHVIIRVPQRLHSLFTELGKLIDLKEIFPNINFFYGDRQSLMLEHCKSADVILFTGRPKNFRQIREQVNKNTLVIYNGVGHNPLIITEFADIDVAVQKTVDVKLFNNGQDCAGSDAILVHEAVAPLFLEKLVASLKDFSVESKYPIEEERLCVGPLYESEDVHRAVKLIGEMTSNGLQILFGGEVNLKSNLLYPTVLIGELGKHTSYEELYAPVFPILTYKQDQELALYFQDADKRYQEKEMYVSVFGRSSFVHLLRGSIILQEKTIHEVERGNYEYGGYGSSASAWSYRGLTVYKPILVPQEIYNVFGKQNPLIAHIPRIKGNWSRTMFEKVFPEKVKEIFGTNLRFAYGFGSFAAGRDRRVSDIDTLVCVEHVREEEAVRYLEWLIELHHFFGKVIDFTYPMELMSVSDLSETLARLKSYKVNADQNPSWVYDALIWGHSLAGPKIAVINPHNIPEDWLTYMHTEQMRLMSDYLQSLREKDSVEHLHSNIPLDDVNFDKWLKEKEGLNMLALARTIPFKENSIWAHRVVYILQRLRLIGSSELNPSSLVGCINYRL